MAPLPGGGALYRTLTLAEGALTVTVDVQRHRDAGVRALHRNRHDLPQAADGRSITRLLLGAADEATRAALARPHQGGGTRPTPAVPSAAAPGRRQFAATPSEFAATPSGA